MNFNWDPIKNRKLKEERGISFEEIIEAIHAGNVVDVLDHPNAVKYSHKKIFIRKEWS